MNVKTIEKIIAQLLKEIGEDSMREGLKNTPQRVAKTFQTIFSGYSRKVDTVLTTFENEGYDEMIVVKDIEFYSMCEHHLLPFYGKVHIGYIPDKKLIGLSKLPRVIEIYSRRLQNQERLTSEIAEDIQKSLNPKGVGVVIEARHFCMMARGVQKQGSNVTTSSVRGLFKKDMNTRSEFLRLITMST